MVDLLGSPRITPGAGHPQGQLTVFGHDDDQIPDEQILPVAETSFLPAFFAGRQFNAGQDAVVESIHVAVPNQDVGKLGLHDPGLPQAADGPRWPG